MSKMLDQWTADGMWYRMREVRDGIVAEAMSLVNAEVAWVQIADADGCARYTTRAAARQAIARWHRHMLEVEASTPAVRECHPAATPWCDAPWLGVVT